MSSTIFYIPNQEISTDITNRLYTIDRKVGLLQANDITLAADIATIDDQLDGDGDVTFSNVTTDTLQVTSNVYTGVGAFVINGGTPETTTGIPFAYAPAQGLMYVNGDLLIDADSVSINTQPTSANHAATKAYVDAAANGMSWKAPCRAASNGSYTVTYLAGVITAVSNGVLAVDNVAIQLNDRILMKNQSSSLQNGIYTCTTLGDVSTKYVLTRAEDADNSPSGEVLPGMACMITEGTANADCGFILTTNAPITLGTTGLDFTLFTTVNGTVAMGGQISGNSNNATLVNSAVIGKVLTGYSSGAGVIAATDTILQAVQKLNGNTAAINGLRYSPATGVAHTGSGNLSATGVKGTYIGQGAGLALTSGVKNTLIGYNSGNEITSGGSNTAIGQEALLTLTTTSSNTAVGDTAGALATGSSSTFLGASSGTSYSSGDQATCLGATATCTSGTSNATAVGYGAVATASNSMVLGNGSVTLVKTSGAIQSSSTIRGTRLLDSNGNVIVRGDVTTGSTLLGRSGNGTMTGTGNTLTGYEAGLSLTSGVNNTINGYVAGRSITTGSNSVASGYGSLNQCTEGDANVAIGHNALNALISADNCTAVGKGALQSVDYGPDNVGVGKNAGSNYTGYQSIFVGTDSGPTHVTGEQCTIIGHGADAANTIVNATAIGAFATVDASNKIQLGNSSVTACHTYGALTAVGGLSTSAISLSGSASGNFQKTVLTGTYSGAVTSGTQHVYISRNGWTVTLNFDGFTDVATADGYLDFSVTLPTWALPSSSLVSADYPTTYQSGFLAFETGVRRPDCMIEIENALNANPTDVGRIRIMASNGGTFTDTHAIGILPGNSVTYLVN